jgi:hypothetical protein
MVRVTVNFCWSVTRSVGFAKHVIAFFKLLTQLKVALVDATTRQSLIWPIFSPYRYNIFHPMDLTQILPVLTGPQFSAIDLAHFGY